MRSHAIRFGIVTVIASAALWGSSGIAAAGGGCMHSTGATTGRGDAVEIVDMCFTSTVLYVERGTEVTWTNRDDFDHNVVGVGGTWGNLDLTLNKGDTVSYRFDEDGVFPYACWIHPGMVGAIVVGDGVGKDLAGVVAGTSTEAGDAASAQGVSAPAVQDGNVDTTTIIWIVVAALVLAGLGWAFAVAMRNRRKATVAG
jgi:plastocyanin